MPPKRSDGTPILARPVIFDIRDIPQQTRIDAYNQLQGKVRTSQRGWDRFCVGDYEITNARFTNMHAQIKKACMARDLAWRWEFRRVQNPDDPTDTSVWYLVTRLR